MYGYYGYGGNYGIIIIGGAGYYYGSPYRQYYYGHYYPSSSRGSCAASDFECICTSQYNARDSGSQNNTAAIIGIVIVSLCCLGVCVWCCMTGRCNGGGGGSWSSHSSGSYSESYSSSDHGRKRRRSHHNRGNRQN